MSAPNSSYTQREILIADLMLIIVAFIWGAGMPMSALLAREITLLWAVSSLQTAILTVVFVFMTFGLVYSTASKQSFL
ncbi:MAG: hypothetical protein RR214_01240 [Synergistaceae bacterium]